MSSQKGDFVRYRNALLATEIYTAETQKTNWSSIEVVNHNTNLIIQKMK